MPTRYSRKGGRTYKRGGFSFEDLKREIGDAKSAVTARVKDISNKAKEKAKKAKEQVTNTTSDVTSAVKEKEYVPVELDYNSSGGKRRGGRATRRGGKRRGGRATRRGGKRRGGRRYKGGSGTMAAKCKSLGFDKGDSSSSGTTISSSDAGGGTWKDITSSGDGPHQLQATDHNNDGSSSSTTSGSDTLPSGNAWNSSSLGPFGGGPNPSWGAPLNTSSAKITFSGGSRRRGGNPKKGQKSRTMKNRKDFTTKYRSKWFNRYKHRQNHAQGSKKIRLPFMKGGGCGCSGASASSPPPGLGLQ